MSWCRGFFQFAVTATFRDFQEAVRKTRQRVERNDFASVGIVQLVKRLPSRRRPRDTNAIMIPERKIQKHVPLVRRSAASQF